MNHSVEIQEVPKVIYCYNMGIFLKKLRVYSMM